MKIAICDDENKILDEVSSYIESYIAKKPEVNLDVVRFNSAKALMNALDNGRTFDIFLLDVYIGDEMGTDLAREIRKKGIESPIVFITTSVEHAPQSFETGTLRYLIKPINPEKFYEAIDAAVVSAKQVGGRFIKLKTDIGIQKVNVNHIMFTESHGHYQYITLEDGSQLRVRMTVAELLNILLDFGGFVRVGSAYIINLRNIKNVSTSEVNLYNDIKINIPRGKHVEIKKAFWDFQYERQEK